MNRDSTTIKIDSQTYTYIMQSKEKPNLQFSSIADIEDCLLSEIRLYGLRYICEIGNSFDNRIWMVISAGACCSGFTNGNLLTSSLISIDLEFIDLQWICCFKIKHPKTTRRKIPLKESNRGLKHVVIDTLRQIKYLKITN